MARKPDSPQASSWDKLSGKDARQTLANREVFDGQQLDRSKIDAKRGPTGYMVLAGVLSTLIAIVLWVVISAGMMGVGMFSTAMAGAGSSSSSSETYYDWVTTPDAEKRFCYQAMDKEGVFMTNTPCYADEEDAQANPPKWYVDQVAAEKAAAQNPGAVTGPAPEASETKGFVSGFLLDFNLWKLLAALGGGGIAYIFMYPYFLRTLTAQNLMNDTEDINQYAGDQHIALPEEIMRTFDWFPDVGAHSNVQVSSMISHVMLTNKGLKKVQLSRFAQEDLRDSDGDIEYLEGEVLRDDNEQILSDLVPMIDEAFGDALFDASGLPKDKTLRKKYDTTQIAYNADGGDRDKQGKHKTVADLINADWTLPDYEPQRPGGAYLVDTAPVNTMVLAMTRAGKGQTYIEPMIDMWLREKRPSNMVINDPKGELLKKHFVRATMRGFQVVQFNLINSMKTDIYNPLGMAAEAAREGDSTKCAQYVDNIADVFFPVDGGDDPVWPNAANNAFKRAAYGLIDYYLDDERTLRAYAARVNMDPKVLETQLDERWGKVTLYNCYQLFVQLTSKKVKNPMKDLEERAKRKEFGDPQGDDFRDEEYEAERTAAQRKEFLWEDKPETDMLGLYFSATQALPTNGHRTLIANANNALKAMAGAEKMLASVYGIAITAMSFFTDPTISTLTSGTPSQNTDLGGLSFPRRMGVRFSMNYLKRDHLIGLQAKWRAYSDSEFSNDLGKDFEHDDIVSREGWARYYFEGKFTTEVAYLRLQLVNPSTGMLVRTFHFKFTKDYQTSLSGRSYITDPITKEKIVKNGVLIELKKNKAGFYKPGHTMYPQMRLTNITLSMPEKEMSEERAISSMSVRYSEAPKVVFLVTPPHLMKYAKLILILVKQLVDLNFDKSYMTKESQKPLYKTRFMLDELGNLQSDGHGISGFETMLSIGLGQEQQFTLILQTLQQLRDVYGESVDKIVQGNVSNIVYLKSTDDSMLDTLQKMSGTRHVVYRDSKTVTKDTERFTQFNNVEGKVSYTMSAKEEPVISYNDMAFIAERNSIVIRAGDSPVWNRNETILPMSFRLFKNTIIHPGHDYTLQTIPTLSSALEFDVRMNQPDFEKMLAKRMEQAEFAESCKNVYREAYDYTELDITRLDPDVYSDGVMALVDASMREEVAQEHGLEDPDMIDPDMMDGSVGSVGNWEADMELQMEISRLAQAKAVLDEKIYAQREISRAMLVTNGGTAKSALDAEVVEAYKSVRSMMEADGNHFSVNGSGDLCSVDRTNVYISKVDESSAIRAINSSAKDEKATVYAESDVKALLSYEVHGAFYEYLAKLNSWQDIARGEFDRAMYLAMRNKEDETLDDQALPVMA